MAQSKIDEDPRLKIMWAGYAFAADFREERGHAYMLDDQTFTVAAAPAAPIALKMFNAHSWVRRLMRSLFACDSSSICWWT